jgi:hypothetical protein
VGSYVIPPEVLLESKSEPVDEEVVEQEQEIEEAGQEGLR